MSSRGGVGRSPVKLAFCFGLLGLAACSKSPSGAVPGEGGAPNGDAGGIVVGGDAGSDAAVGTPLVLANFQAAEVVIGQADFVSNVPPAAPGAATTDSPLGSGAFDGNNLFLPDTYTHRVRAMLRAMQLDNSEPESV